jgi:hypothetical protein
MHLEWFATEHYRLHRVEEWPDSPRKEAALGAIRSSLASLTRNLPPAINPPSCDVCASRKQLHSIVEFPVERSQNGSASADRAA